MGVGVSLILLSACGIFFLLLGFFVEPSYEVICIILLYHIMATTINFTERVDRSTVLRCRELAFQKNLDWDVVYKTTYSTSHVVHSKIEWKEDFQTPLCEARVTLIQKPDRNTRRKRQTNTYDDYESKCSQ